MTQVEFASRIAEYETRLAEEEQDAKLLGAKLTKTGQNVQDALHILTGFDSRVQSLEIKVLPIYTATQKLSKLYENMDRTLSQLQQVKQYLEQDKLEEPTLQPLIRGEFSRSELDKWFHSLDRLRLAYGYIIANKIIQADPILQRERSLIMNSCAKLDKMMRYELEQNFNSVQVGIDQRELLMRLESEVKQVLVKESHTDPAELDTVDQFVLVNRNALESVSLIAKYLAGYESDAILGTSSGSSTDLSHIKTHTECRSNFMQKILNPIQQQVAQNFDKKLNDGGLYIKGSGLALIYTKIIFGLVNNEWILLNKIIQAGGSYGGNANIQSSRSQKKSFMDNIFEQIVKESLTKYFETIGQILVKIKRHALQNHDLSFLFFVYDLLYLYVDSIDISMSSSSECLKWFSTLKEHCPKIYPEFIKIMNDCIVMALRSFSELTDDINNVGLNKNMPEDGIVHELSSNTLSFLKKIVDFAPAVDLMLRLYQQSASGSSFDELTADSELCMKLVAIRKSTRLNSAPDDFSALKKYVVDSLQLLLTNLEARATKGYKKGPTGSKPVVGCVFMLNNCHYILKSLKSNQQLSNITTSEFEALLDKKIQTEIHFYVQVWDPLIMNLMDGVGMLITISANMSQTDRQKIKDRFKHFNDGYDDIIVIQRKLVIPDAELRERVVVALKKHLIPVYTKFFNKFATSNFTKNAEKYIKFDVASLESSVDKFFDPANK